MGDIIAGITVAIMHIPQGMAYGLLAGLDPIVGLYMAFFPTLVYFFFGTSRHVSTGTFAVVSIMTSKIIGTYSTTSSIGTIENATEPIYTNYQVATAVTMVCGLFQLVMCVFRLGALTSLLSQSLVSGFTTAAGELKTFFSKVFANISM
jgi:solute carrier family 26 protein